MGLSPGEPVLDRGAAGEAEVVGFGPVEEGFTEEGEVATDEDVATTEWDVDMLGGAEADGFGEQGVVEGGGAGDTPEDGGFEIYSPLVGQGGCGREGRGGVLAGGCPTGVGQC